MSEFAKLEGETSASWLTRLVGLGAPQDIRADVRAILESEKENGKIKHHLFAFIVLRLVLSFSVLFSSCIFRRSFNMCCIFFCFLQGGLAKRSDGAVEEVNLLVENCKCSF